MEKPLTVDGPTSKRMLALGEEAARKNLKVGVGLMCRHCRARGELADRIGRGEIGDILMMRAYRLHGPVGFFASPPKPADKTDLMYQIERFHSFIWASGGGYSDFNIHHIDHLCWMKNAWPAFEASLAFGILGFTSPEAREGLDALKERREPPLRLPLVGEEAPVHRHRLAREVLRLVPAEDRGHAGDPARAQRRAAPEGTRRHRARNGGHGRAQRRVRLRHRQQTRRLACLAELARLHGRCSGRLSRTPTRSCNSPL